jgi:hypothetical protein
MILERAGRPLLGSEIWDVVSKQFGKPQKIPELTARHRMRHQLSLLRDARYVCPSLAVICAPTPALTAACASCTRPPTQREEVFSERKEVARVARGFRPDIGKSQRRNATGRPQIRILRTDEKLKGGRWRYKYVLAKKGVLNRLVSLGSNEATEKEIERLEQFESYRPIKRRQGDRKRR